MTALVQILIDEITFSKRKRVYCGKKNSVSLQLPKVYFYFKINYQCAASPHEKRNHE